MLDWIKKLLGPADAEPRGGADRELLRELKKELEECEALYRAGTQMCLESCPDKIGRDPQKFSRLMLDLYRALLIKVLIEVAQSDRRWQPAERELALVVLRHVWGVKLKPDQLSRVLRDAARRAATIRWASLLTPFAKLPPLADHLAELNTHVMRIANLVAKADGEILPGEVGALRLIQTEMDKLLERREKASQSPQGEAAVFDKQAAQAVQSQGAGPTKARPGAMDAGIRHAGAEERPREEILAEAMAELDQLIGLDAVKKDIHQMVSFLKVQVERERHELPRTQVSLHTIFRGNPGTGKTTVARILGRAFAGLGILQKGHTIETDRSGLVAQYAGQTGPRVNQRVDEALDGVLFIDEAYSLVADRGEDPYGTEAVQVLLKRMEDDRRRLVVVLAGYPAPMERMLRSNPGLASRFQRAFDFPDYSADELLRIFESMCAKNHYTLGEAAREKLLFVFQSQLDVRDEHFGNGRLARNLFEQSIRHMASRIITVTPLTRELLTMLQAEDIALK